VKPTNHSKKLFSGKGKLFRILSLYVSKLKTRALRVISEDLICLFFLFCFGFLNIFVNKEFSIGTRPQVALLPVAEQPLSYGDVIAGYYIGRQLRIPEVEQPTPFKF
jgi:hypothetical protein